MGKCLITKIGKGEILDNIIFLFLILSTLIPGFISILYGSYDLWRWKAVMLYICASVLLVLLVVKWLRYKIPLTDWLTYLPIAVLFLIVIISSLLSKYGSKVLLGSQVFYEGALTLISYYIIFIAYKSYVTSNNKMRKMVNWIFITGIFLYSYSWLQVIFNTNVDYIFDGGTFGHRNYMASYYTLLIIPAIAFYFYAETKIKSIIYYIMSCMFFSSIIIVHTRSAWIGNTVGLFLFFILARRKISLKKLVILLASFVLIVILINNYFKGFLLVRFDSMVNDVKILADVNTPKSEKNLAEVGNYRYPLWILTLKTIPKYFLFGAGPDMFVNVFPHEEYRKITGTADMCYNAHNEYLNLVITIGIFGLAAYIWLIVILVRKSIRAYRFSEMNDQSLFLYVGVFCGWSAYLVQAFFNNSVVPTSPTLWALMGILSTINLPLSNNIPSINKKKYLSE